MWAVDRSHAIYFLCLCLLRNAYGSQTEIIFICYPALSRLQENGCICICWDFPNLVVCNIYAEALCCSLLRSFADFLLRTFFCALLRSFALFACICVSLCPTAFRTTAWGTAESATIKSLENMFIYICMCYEDGSSSDHRVLSVLPFGRMACPIWYAMAPLKFGARFTMFFFIEWRSVIVLLYLYVDKVRVDHQHRHQKIIVSKTLLASSGKPPGKIPGTSQIPLFETQGR